MRLCQNSKKAYFELQNGSQKEVDIIKCYVTVPIATVTKKIKHAQAIKKTRGKNLQQRVCHEMNIEDHSIRQMI